LGNFEVEIDQNLRSIGHHDDRQVPRSVICGSRIERIFATVATAARSTSD
jgi:hypothetical protein